MTPVIVGIDPAGASGDESSIVLMQGNVVLYAGDPNNIPPEIWSKYCGELKPYNGHLSMMQAQSANETAA